MGVNTAAITDIGRAEIASARSGGLQIIVGGAVFGSTQISSNEADLASLTALPNQVFACDTSLITYRGAGEDKILFTIRLNNTIGDFDIGSFGLVSSSGNLFTVTSLGEIDSKTKSNGSYPGDFRFYEMIVDVSGQANILNTTILVSEDASLPEVDNESLLPSPNASTFPVYYVHKWTQYHNKPAIASRYNGLWYYYPAFEGFHPELFGAGVVPGNAVYFDYNQKKFLNAVVNDIDRTAVGLCGENYCFIALGGTYVSPIPGTYIAGARYFLSGNPGKLSTSFSFTTVGYAASDTILITNNYFDNYKVVGRTLVIIGDSNDSSIYMIRQDAPADQRYWQINSGTNQLTFSAKNDINTIVSPYLNVARNGYTITGVTLGVIGSTNLISSSSGIEIRGKAATVYVNNTNDSVYHYTPTVTVGTELNKYSASIFNTSGTLGSFSFTPSEFNINYANTSTYFRFMKEAWYMNVTNGTGFNATKDNMLLQLNPANYVSLFQAYDTQYPDRIPTVNQNPALLRNQASILSDTIALGKVDGNNGKGNILAYSDLFVRKNWAGAATGWALAMSSADFSYSDSTLGGFGCRVIRGPGWKIIIGYGVSRGTLGDLIYFPEPLDNYYVMVSGSNSLAYWADVGGYFHPIFYGSQAYDRNSFIVTGVKISAVNGINGNAGCFADYQGANGFLFTYIAIGK